MQLMLLIVYLMCSFLVGFILVKRIFSVFPKLLQLVGAFLLGTIISTVAVYGLAVLFKTTPDPINAGIIVFCVATVILIFMYFKKYRGFIPSLRVFQFSTSDIAVAIFSFVFALYIMMKTFRYGTGSTLLIGSNVVFDFGHALSIMRSFSWGQNIPFASPFVAHTPHLYHFMFYFYTAIYEHLGIPLVYALNIPSILSFAAMLICIYYLPQILVKSARGVGILTMILSITHSTAAFVIYIFQKPFSFSLFSDIWNLAKYPFAAPYDKSNISLFWTLNVFVNQRHLAIGIAVTLFLIMGITTHIRKRKIISLVLISLFGLITGLLILWHMMMSAACLVIIGGILLFEKQWKNVFFYTLTTILTWVFCFWPWFSVIGQLIFPVAHSLATQPVITSNPYFNLISWLVVNIGVSLITVLAGILVLKEKRYIIIPFLALIIASFIINIAAGAESYQKFMNIWVIFANSLSAIFLVWVWQKNRIAKLLAVFLFVLLAGSGFLDFMVIKNDFMYPVTDAPDNKLIAFIKEKTKPTSVFLTYPDIFDPVTLSGRNNFSGFYRHIGQPDRRELVKQMYEIKDVSENLLLISQKIDYVIIPMWKKNDFTYLINPAIFVKAFPIVYQEDKHVVLEIKSQLAP